MSQSTATIVVSIVLIALPLAWTVWMWVRRHSTRALVRGIGAALIPVGLWLVGLTRLITIWLQQAVDWVRATRMTTTAWVGLAVVAAGVVAWLAAGYLDPVTRKQAKAWRQGRKQTQAAASPAKPSVAAQKQPRSKTPQAPASANPDKAGFTDEDRELMNLLKDRGID